MYQEKTRTIHVYFEEGCTEDGQSEEAEVSLIIEAPDAAPEAKPYSKPLGILCGVFFALLCVATPLLAALLPQLYPNTYDTSLSKTITLTLTRHPGAGQLPLYALAEIKQTQEASVTATGSIHQEAMKATGLLTFYNGLLTQQVIPITTLAGKDGINVTTAKEVVIPPATPTSPPTYGTVSVTAYTSISGTLGNIAALDINGACCGASVLAQNLYPFTGGQDARDIPVLTKTDLATGTHNITSQVATVVNDQAQQEVKPGYIMLPLDCSQTLTATHQAGEQTATAILTLAETCIPLAYFAPDIAARAQQQFTIPQGYHLVSFSAYIAESHVNQTGGILTIQAIAYLKQNEPTLPTYHFVGK